MPCVYRRGGSLEKSWQHSYKIEQSLVSDGNCTTEDVFERHQKQHKMVNDNFTLQITRSLVLLQARGRQ